MIKSNSLGYIFQKINEEERKLVNAGFYYFSFIESKEGIKLIKSLGYNVLSRKTPYGEYMYVCWSKDLLKATKVEQVEKKHTLFTLQQEKIKNSEKRYNLFDLVELLEYVKKYDIENLKRYGATKVMEDFLRYKRNAE